MHKDYFWVETDYNKDFYRQMSESFGFPEIISKIIAEKSLDTPEESKRLLKPELANLYNPFLMDGVEEGVQRILEAIKNDETVAVYGDYDVDGVTATALLLLALKRFQMKLIYFIPNRLESGYGLSRASIDDLKKKDVNLIITVDCGINACDEIEYAKSLGIDVIITDHHTPKEELPDAAAIINPKICSPKYPFDELAGVGVAFKLMQALYENSQIDKELLFEHLDLVALGTIADIVPLVDENRIFSRFGLSAIKNSKKPGINALIEICGLQNKRLETNHIVYTVAPRINAVGRIGSAERAIKLLISDNDEESFEIAKILDYENKVRRALDDNVFKRAKSMIERSEKLSKRNTIVLSSDDWHPGIIGIVAAKLTEKFYKPAVLISFSEGIGKGSARSIPELNLFDAITASSRYLDSFGGHKYAAGLTIQKENLEEFSEVFEDIVTDMIVNKSKDIMQRKLLYTSEIKFEQINFEIMIWLSYLAPYGPGNKRPVFISRNVYCKYRPYIVGKNHIKFNIFQDDIMMEAIGYNFGDKYLLDDFVTKKFNIAYVLEENFWGNKKTIQMRLKDIKFNE